jgi:hypothetical protein
LRRAVLLQHSSTLRIAIAISIKMLRLAPATHDSNPLLQCERMAANPAKDATAESSPPGSREAAKPDLLTIAAIEIVAAVVADFIHEGLGHGGMCIATGARPLMLSTVHFECSADTCLVAVGGTLANLSFGTLAWGCGRAVKQQSNLHLRRNRAKDSLRQRTRLHFLWMDCSA